MAKSKIKATAAAKARSESFDVVVIGAGSAGYAAARSAAAAGAKTAIIEGGVRVGGLCILRGCMPSKALLESAHRWHHIRRADEFGLAVVPKRPHLDQIIARKRRLIGGFASYRRRQLASDKFTFLRGPARLADAHTIMIRRMAVRAKAIVISTGSVIPILPVNGLRETGFLTSDEALELTKLPKDLIVLGGGLIAVELGQYFQHLGTQVTLIQRSPHIVKENDDDVCTALEEALREDGMNVITGTKLLSIRRAGRRKEVVYERNGRKKTAQAEEILYSLGRVPATAGLGLAAAGVALDHERIKVDTAMATSQPHIFAAGDVTGLFEVVHTAISQGEVAGYNAALAAGATAGAPRHMDYRLKASVIFTEPEVASVGRTEKECQAEGIPFLAASYPFADHGKSIVMGATQGFVKIIASPANGEILGAHIVGPHASDLIHELIAIMHFRGTVKDLATIPHYHPTLAEIFTYPAEELAEKIQPTG